jgi:hypothetical protein
MNTKLLPPNSNLALPDEAPSRDQIARLAYQLYLEHGRRDGHDVEDWLSAEQLLKERASCSLAFQPFEPVAKRKTQPPAPREYSYGTTRRGSDTREESPRPRVQMRAAGKALVRQSASSKDSNSAGPALS